MSFSIGETCAFAEPQKCIHTEDDVVAFQKTLAYARITSFIRFLCDAVEDTFRVPSPPVSKPVQYILDVLDVCEGWIARCPPHTGARRFGNMAFREWHALLDRDAPALVQTLVPVSLHAAIPELLPYLTGSFGSAQRLDFGTGHELSFMAFLSCLFQCEVLDTTHDARTIALVVFRKYLGIIQKLIVLYTLEPAGSHGVWGLDDHFAMPYVLGAAQLSHHDPSMFPTPASITTARDVEEFRSQNFYFNAIGFINDVKKGPFWEHSPILYDVSGIDSWAKIAVGMRKMYHAEVLGKFPVVQHFPFGSNFFPFRQSSGAEERVVAALDAVQAKTQSLRVSEQATESAALDADTPLTRKSQVMQPPTSVPWKQQSRSQQPATTNWFAGSSRHTSQSRTPNMQVHPQSGPLDHQEEPEPSANMEGLEDGLGINGLPGTKAPFSGQRTIHPVVLESMRQRGDQV